MNDPKRRRLGNRPAYSYQGCIAALPLLCSWPTGKDICRISIVLLVDQYGAVSFEKDISSYELLDLLNSYKDDPEKFFLETFGYKADKVPLEKS